jgi:DNA-binding transcriptional LysR family regulator
MPASAVLEAHEDCATPIVAIYPTRKHLAPKVRLFIDHLVEAERESLTST